jgi:hypothetical protein
MIITVNKTVVAAGATPESLKTNAVPLAMSEPASPTFRLGYFKSFVRK